MWGGLGLASIPNGPFNQLPNSCQAQLWAIRARHNCGLVSREKLAKKRLSERKRSFAQSNPYFAGESESDVGAPAESAC